MSARGDCNGDAILPAGATGRVGAATLTALVREGARVVVISRDRERALATIDTAPSESNGAGRGRIPTNPLQGPKPCDF